MAVNSAHGRRNPSAGADNAAVPAATAAAVVNNDSSPPPPPSEPPTVVRRNKAHKHFSSSMTRNIASWRRFSLPSFAQSHLPNDEVRSVPTVYYSHTFGLLSHFTADRVRK